MAPKDTEKTGRNVKLPLAGSEKMARLRVVSNFGDCDCGAGNARARVYFARPTIAIAKIRDYSQSSSLLLFSIL